MNWFKFRGTDSRDMHVIVSEYPPETRAGERVKPEPIPGRHGTVEMLAGRNGQPVYESYTQTMLCAALEGANMDAVRTWLSGRGALILGNNPKRMRQVSITEQADYERILRGHPQRRLSLKYLAQPFQYLAEPELIIKSAPDVLMNPGTMYAEPTITIYGSGDIALLIGASTVFLSGVEGQITIDCAAKMTIRRGQAGQPDVLEAYKQTGDYPMMQPGAVPIGWTGNVSKVEIEPGWRWL